MFEFKVCVSLKHRLRSSYSVFFSHPAAGVSNWGGYAVACGLYLLHTCPSHLRYLKRGLGPEFVGSKEQQRDWRTNLPSVQKVTT